MENKNKSKIHEKNKLNDLTGSEWKYATMSVIDKVFPVDFQHKKRSEHGGQKPPRLCEHLIKMFTKKGQLVLDPFAGVGGSLIGASICGRKCIGIDINEKWKKIYEEVCELENLEKQDFLIGDSNILLDNLKEEVDLILTDVPYWNMDKLKSNRSKKSERQTKLSKFNENSEQTLGEWILEMKTILNKSFNRLKNNGYLVVFIGDLYRNKNFYPLSSFLSLEISKFDNIKFKSDIIWVDKSKSLHIFGYPFSYVPSIIHQHILVFKKEN